MTAASIYNAINRNGDPTDCMDPYDGPHKNHHLNNDGRIIKLACYLFIDFHLYPRRYRFLDSS